jgi:hypothetical protein
VNKGGEEVHGDKAEQDPKNRLVPLADASAKRGALFDKAGQRRDAE